METDEQPAGEMEAKCIDLFGNRIGIEPNTQYYTNMEVNVYGKRFVKATRWR